MSKPHSTMLSSIRCRRIWIPVIGRSACVFSFFVVFSRFFILSGISACAGLVKYNLVFFVAGLFAETRGNVFHYGLFFNVWTSGYSYRFRRFWLVMAVFA